MSTGFWPVSSAGPKRARRDYAILLLLVTYGLCGREVAALTLDHIDWKRERLAIPERKAGHCTAFPSRLSSARPCSTTSSIGRPATTDRPCSSEPRLRADRSGLRRCPRLPALTAAAEMASAVELPMGGHEHGPMTTTDVLGAFEGYVAAEDELRRAVLEARREDNEQMLAVIRTEVGSPGVS